MAHDIIIVGGGISGLSLARELKSKADLDIRVLESGTRLGGVVSGVEDSGFLMETGANGFLDRVPFTLDLAQQLGLSDELQASSSLAKKRYLMLNGTLQALPESPKAFMRTKTLTLGGKLRAGMERFKSKQKPGVEESVADFVRRRLGSQVLDRYVDAFVSGVFAGDPESLSVDAAFPKLRFLEQEYGGLIKGSKALAMERKEQGGEDSSPTGTLWSFKKGLSTLIHALGEQLQEEIMLDTNVHGIRYNAGLWHVLTQRGTLQTKRLVLATPSYVSANFLRGSFKEISSVLDSIPYAPIAVVGLGLRREDVEHSLDGFGYLCPESEKRPVLGCLFSSEIFPGTRAPEGHVFLRVMLGGARHPEAIGQNPGECFERAVSEVREVLGFRNDPMWSRVIRWERGIPQYNMGHQSRLANVEALMAERAPELYLHGNAYRGIGINNCIEESSKLAAILLG